uniref:EOG090X0IGM n=1 Tax=Alona affinis TaxID=381656 RepID=A0A9N6WT13_9CRUS|nr:EOG090X0IGM [Alona affinis]
MALRLLKSFNEALLQFEAVYIAPILWRKPPPPELLMPVAVQSNLAALQQQPPPKPFDINSIFDGFLWGAPTFRRSVERRMMRKYGAENWETGKKLIPIRKDLKPCVSCGHYHEAGRLCPNCYAKIKAETTAIQEEMVKELGLNPVDKEVVIMYEGEKQEHDDEFFQGKRIVEMKKTRPAWFSKNLLQKSGPAAEAGGSSDEATAIKPHNLG